MYATPRHLTDATASGDLPDYLKLWRFERYYRLSADQLPHVLCREALDAGALKFRRWQHPEQMSGARIWLFRLPSGQIVTALSLDVYCELIDTIDLLEDCYFADVQIGETAIEACAHTLAAQLGADSSQCWPGRGAVGAGLVSSGPAADPAWRSFIARGH